MNIAAKDPTQSEVHVARKNVVFVHKPSTLTAWCSIIENGIIKPNKIGNEHNLATNIPFQNGRISLVGIIDWLSLWCTRILRRLNLSSTTKRITKINITIAI